MRPKKIQDPVLYALKRSWFCSKNQAKYRGQIWRIDFDDYAHIWLKDNRYLNKGRGSDSYHLARKDRSKPWTTANVYVVKRGEHASKIMMEKNEQE